MNRKLIFFILLLIFNLTAKGYPLFDEYPLLKNKFPYIQLGNWPTPIQKASHLGQELGLNNLYIKREDLSGDRFGGNKVRKLELLLADAQSKGYSMVLTYGGLASNHVAATAAYADSIGMQSMALLMQQHPVANLKRNLLLSSYYNCRIFLCPAEHMLSDAELKDFLTENAIEPMPYVIPIGGSNHLGVIASMTAIFELKKQLAQGVMPEPDYIYVPFGSMGTTAGLLLGIKATGLKTRVLAIRVTGNPLFNTETLCALIRTTNHILHSADETFPLFDWNKQNLFIPDDYLGEGYGKETTAAQAAMELFANHEQIILDQSYTAKAAAALIHDARTKNINPNAVILFWNSYCAADFSSEIACVDRRNIPPQLQQYL